MKQHALTLAVLALVPASATAAFHGGVYRGPGTGIGPGGSAPGTAGPSSGGAAGGASSDWSSWWSFNRDPYLALKDALSEWGPATGTGSYDLGLGQRAEQPPARRPQEPVLAERVVPALLRALAAEDDADLVTATLLALAKIGCEAADAELPRLEPLFTRYLADSNQEIAETAALALGVLGRDGAATALAALLDDTESARSAVGRDSVPDRTRALAAYGLGLVAHRSRRADARAFAVQRSSGALARDSQRSPDVPTACLLALELVPLASGGEFPDEIDVARGLLARSREELCAWLIAWFRSTDAPAAVRAHAPLVLAHQARGAAPSARAAVSGCVLDVLRPNGDAPQDVRRAATLALGLLDREGARGDAALCETLVRLASDRDGFVRGAARVSLARIGARASLVDDADDFDARSWLLRDLVKGRPTTRSWTALALGLMERHRLVAGAQPSEDVRSALRTSLAEEGGPSEVGALCTALGLCRDLGAADLVRARLAAGVPEGVRAYAAVALGMMGDLASIETLREVVRVSVYSPGLQREAAIALGLLGDLQVVPDLAKALRGAKTLSSQSSIASALGTIGDARAIEPLLVLLADREVSALTRAFAAAALGIVGDKERLPWNSKLAVDLYYGAPPPTLIDPLGARGVLDLL